MKTQRPSAPMHRRWTARRIASVVEGKVQKPSVSVAPSHSPFVSYSQLLILCVLGARGAYITVVVYRGSFVLQLETLACFPKLIQGGIISRIQFHSCQKTQRGRDLRMSEPHWHRLLINLLL